MNYLTYLLKSQQWSFSLKEIMHNGYKEFLVSFDEFKEVLKPENKMKLAEKLVQQIIISFTEDNQIQRMN